MVQRLSREFLDRGSNARSVMDRVAAGMMKRAGLSCERWFLETYSAVFVLISNMTVDDVARGISLLASSDIVAERMEGDGLRVRVNLDVPVSLAKSRMPDLAGLIDKIEQVKVVTVPDREKALVPALPPPPPPEPVETKAVVLPPVPVEKSVPLPRKKSVNVVKAPDSLPVTPQSEETPAIATLGLLKDRVKDAVLSMGKPFEHFYLPIERTIEQDEGCVLKVFVIAGDDVVKMFHEALKARSITFIPSFSGSRDKVGNLIRFPDPTG